MCIEDLKKIKRKKKYYYKALTRQGRDLITPMTKMVLKEDTTIWQKPEWNKDLPVDKIYRVVFEEEHLGKLSVFHTKKPCHNLSHSTELWKVEVRDKDILTGHQFNCDASLVNEIRLVEFVEKITNGW